MVMWICKKCENLNTDLDHFCVVCGTEKTGAAETAAEAGANREPYVEPRRTTIPPVYEDPKPRVAVKKESEMSALQERYDKLTRTANLLKAGVVLCVLMAFVFFAQPYLNYDSDYTIYHLVLGMFDPIEQICSIVLLGFAILPAIFVLFDFDSRRRYLPVTMSWVSLAAVAIYCGVIYFGNTDQNLLPILITLCFVLCVFFATTYVKKLIERENVFFKTGGLGMPKEPVSPQAAAAREASRPIKGNALKPDRNAQSEPTKPRLKSTMDR